MSDFEPTTDRALQALTNVILVCPTMMEHVTLEAWQVPDSVFKLVPLWVVEYYKPMYRIGEWLVRMSDGKVVWLSDDAFKILFYEIDTGVYA